MVDSSYNVAMDSGGVPDVILTMINLAMFLSINLGILNLIPIPGLDGGRLVFLLIEVVRGKPVSQEKEGIVTMIGVIALIALMVVVLFNDIASL
jgi:regulator of sigma E protease